MDNRKILKGLVAVVMIAVIVVLVLITVAHVRMGLYLAMMCYAGYRVFVCVRDIIRK